VPEQEEILAAFKQRRIQFCKVAGILGKRNEEYGKESEH
jgi:hypothetical protein